MFKNFAAIFSLLRAMNVKKRDRVKNKADDLYQMYNEILDLSFRLFEKYYNLITTKKCQTNLKNKSLH